MGCPVCKSKNVTKDQSITKSGFALLLTKITKELENHIGAIKDL